MSNVSKYSNDAIQAAIACQKTTNVPAIVTLAQYDLESSCGKHMPAGSNNPFGIKAKSWQSFVPAMTWEVINGKDVRVTQNFAKYANLEEAFDAHATLLSKPVYKKAIDAWKKGDLDGGIKAMASVYATDPDYGAKVIGIIAIDKLELLVKTYGNKKTSLSLQASAPEVTTPMPVSKPVSHSIETEGNIVESLLSSLFGNFGTTVSAIATAAEYVPEVSNGIVKTIPDGIAFEKACATFIKDMIGGKYGNVATDLPAILEAFNKLLTDFGVTHTAVPNAPKALLEAPSLTSMRKATS